MGHGLTPSFTVISTSAGSPAASTSTPATGQLSNHTPVGMWVRSRPPRSTTDSGQLMSTRPSADLVPGLGQRGRCHPEVSQNPPRTAQISHRFAESCEVSQFRPARTPCPGGPYVRIISRSRQRFCEYRAPAKLRVGRHARPRGPRQVRAFVASYMSPSRPTRAGHPSAWAVSASSRSRPPSRYCVTRLASHEISSSSRPITERSPPSTAIARRLVAARALIGPDSRCPTRARLSAEDQTDQAPDWVFRKG